MGHCGQNKVPPDATAHCPLSSFEGTLHRYQEATPATSHISEDLSLPRAAQHSARKKSQKWAPDEGDAEVAELALHTGRQWGRGNLGAE